jgi:hypothetical protein
MELRFHVPEAEGDVSALVSIPDDVRFVLVRFDISFPIWKGEGNGLTHTACCTGPCGQP